MRPSVTFDTKSHGAPIRLEVSAGLHVNVSRLMTIPEARALIADTEAALACAIEETETKPRELPEAIRAGGTD